MGSQWCLTSFHILNPWFYSCNLYEQPKEGDHNISILRLPKACLLYFVMSQSKMPMAKGIFFELGNPHT
jgi:hypothetical protein